MFKYTNYQLATVIAVPIVTILLLWTLVIFHKNRKKWRAFDIPIVAILVQSILRNAAIITYIVIQKLETPILDVNICSIFVWLFNSIHTFQASCLTTLAVVGLFSLKLYKKQQNLKQYLTTTHVIYHLFCLTTLCACVGVAAILAKQETYVFGGSYDNTLETACKFMPFQLDIKFNVFIIVLHIFLTIISVCTFMYICCVYFKLKKAGFNHLSKSNNHLSQLSLSTVNPNDNKNYYDTYTIQRNGSYGRYDSQAQLNGQGVSYTNGYNTIWKSDISNVSTTVSSTNSRRPLNKASEEDEKPGTGLETIHPVLIVCYLFYHVPIIILCIFPHLILPWSVITIALWLGLLQDVLIPISLGLLDSRFCQWVSKVYRCSEKKVIEGKLPHVGLDGKFRHFGSQPQSLETNQMLPSHIPSGRSYPTSEHKFPITNGSLYTSIDGRLPVIHNYRRHNNENRSKLPETNLINLGIHSSNLQRQDLRDYNQKQLNFRCTNCDKSHCTSTSNLNSDFIRNSVYNLNLNPQNQILLKPYLRHISLSQTSLRQIPLGPPLGETRDYNDPKPDKKVSINNRNNLRLSKSYDSLNDLQSDLTKFKQKQLQQPVVSLDSDDEYFTDSVNLESGTYDQNFDTLSTESSYSITTEANCDFEFYQNDAPIGSQFAALEFKLGSKLSQNHPKSSYPDSKSSHNHLSDSNSRLNHFDSGLTSSDSVLGRESKISNLNSRLSQHGLDQHNSKLIHDDIRFNQNDLNSKSSHADLKLSRQSLIHHNRKLSHDDLILNQNDLSEHNSKLKQIDLRVNQNGLNQFKSKLSHDDLRLNQNGFNQHSSDNIILHVNGLNQHNLKMNHEDLRKTQNGLSQQTSKLSQDDIRLHQNGMSQHNLKLSHDDLRLNQNGLSQHNSKLSCDEIQLNQNRYSQNNSRLQQNRHNTKLNDDDLRFKSNGLSQHNSRLSHDEIRLHQNGLSQPNAYGGLKSNHNDSILHHGGLKLSQHNSKLTQNANDLKLKSRNSFTELECDFPLTRNDLNQFGARLSRNSSKTSSFNDLCRNYRIKRSNSKRSLENLQAYVDTGDFLSANNSLQRSSSVMVLDDRKGGNLNVDYPRKTSLVDTDISYENLKYKGHFYAGSVPDLKKVFISDFI